MKTYAKLGLILVLLWGCGGRIDVPASTDASLCVSPDESTYGVGRDPFSGEPLHWDLPFCLTYVLAQADVTGLDQTDLLAAVQSGMMLWSHPECLQLCVQYQGEVEPETFGYDPDSAQQQSLLWWIKTEEIWTRRHSQVAIAVTSIFTEPWTGRILDADLELNAFGPHHWTVGGTSVSADVTSVVAHEFGHVLGLDHSRDPDAVMATGWEEGWLRRELTLSDEQGLCTLYLCPELLER